ncbi:MAG: FkbM family methyltransferase, partial [Hyphomonas sp.]|nr:FkbM family methyltransferase [Hyphomonas sp.]
MRRVIKSVMYRATKRALAYPPIYVVVRDFLQDNPEALFRILSGRGMAGTFVAQSHLLDATLKTDAFKQAVSERPELARLIFDLMDNVASGQPKVIDTRSLGKMLSAAIVGQSPAERRAVPQARAISQIVQPSAESFSYAREIGALSAGLARDHSLSGSGGLLHAFMSWRAMSAHFSDDWRNVTDLFDGIGTLDDRSFKAILGRLVSRLSEDGVIKLKGGEFRFNDAQAFAETCDEILAREQYHFTTDSAQPYVLDCGVNAGLAIYYVKQLYPNARVIGFEPHEPTAQLARENVERLGLRDVTIHNSAIAGSEGEMQLTVSDNPLGHHLSHATGEPGQSLNTVSVKTEVLSKYIVEPVDFIKLDIEGAETEVLFELGVE